MSKVILSLIHNLSYPDVLFVACPLLVYKKDLEKELKGETSGDFAKLVVALLQVIWLFITSNLLIKQSASLLNLQKGTLILFLPYY